MANSPLPLADELALLRNRIADGSPILPRESEVLTRAEIALRTQDRLLAEVEKRREREASDA